MNTFHVNKKNATTPTSQNSSTLILQIQRTLNKINNYCDHLGRNPPRIIAVTKAHPPQVINLALQAGLTDIGENYVQEAMQKQEWLKKAHVRHFIGHLQRNKVKDALTIFDWIQTVDSFKLLQKIGRISNAYQKPIVFMVQVNFTREAQKHGILPERVIPLLEEYREIRHEYPYLQFKGLMTIGKKDDLKTTRHVFQQCIALGNTIREIMPFKHLEFSFGMSQDYMIALEEGATILRLGRILFGSRPIKPRQNNI